MPYVLSLDLGTSSVRTALYDTRGTALPGTASSRRHRPRQDAEGASELDADAMVRRALRCVEETLAAARSAGVAGEIAAVGLCTFWHSVLGVGEDGRAVTPVLMWSDTRSRREVTELHRETDAAALHARTGCRPHTSYLPARLRWVRRHRPEWHRAARWWMSPGEYLHLHLAGESACGVSMASGTGLYSHAAATWDAEAVALAGVRPGQLLPIVDSLTPLPAPRGAAARRLGPLAGVPWFPAAGDGACSNLGSGCVSRGEVALMVGTSLAMRVMAATAGPGEPPPPARLWKYRLDGEHYLVGGAESNGGGLYAWLRRRLRLPGPAALEAAVAAVPPDGHGLTVLPFLDGERAPGWRGDATAALTGLRSATTGAEVARAALEAVAHRAALIHAELRGLAAPNARVIAGGGALRDSPVWAEIFAGALGCPLLPAEEAEPSARGAALLALRGCGLLPAYSAAPPSLGTPVLPRPGHAACYARARDRQQRLYGVLLESGWERDAAT